MVQPTYSSQGIKYQNTNLGNEIANMLNSEYSMSYQDYVKKVDHYFEQMNDDKIRLYVNKNIGKWIGEFEKNEK